MKDREVFIHETKSLTNKSIQTARNVSKWLYARILWVIVVMLAVDIMVFVAVNSAWGNVLVFLNAIVLAILLLRIWRSRR